MKTHVTILFLLHDDSILLAMKKRGFGEGKWNGIGGKVEPNETPLQAAVRECREEIGVTPLHLKQLGEIDFTMSHDPAFNHYAHVFTARVWQGEPHETDEMRPQWFKTSAIPYQQMWSDDIHWLPLAVQGKRFTAAFTLGPNDELIHTEVHEH